MWSHGPAAGSVADAAPEHAAASGHTTSSRAKGLAPHLPGPTHHAGTLSFLAPHFLVSRRRVSPIMSKATVSGRCRLTQATAYSDGSTAMASIEISRPRGSATLAGAERAGGGSGMKRA